MKKYILNTKSAGFWLGSCRLFDDTGNKEIAKVLVKDTKKIRKNIKQVGKNDESVEFRYNDGHLQLVIKGSLNRKAFSLPKYGEYHATNLQNSSVFFEMHYLGHDKWRVETDSADYRKLISICYGVYRLTAVDIISEVNNSNLP